MKLKHDKLLSNFAFNFNLRQYNEAAPDVPLSDFRVDNGGTSQAVVMCAAVRTAEGAWRVEALGVLSAGNAKGYQPLTVTCKELVAKMK